jgi:hypothetical protein
MPVAGHREGPAARITRVFMNTMSVRSARAIPWDDARQALRHTKLPALGRLTCCSRRAVLLVLPCRNGNLAAFHLARRLCRVLRVLAAAWEVQMAQLLAP